MNSKILQYLLDNKTQEFTINQLAKATKTNYRIAHTQIKLFETQKIVKTKRVGTSLLCSLTQEFNEHIYLAECQRRKELPKKIIRIQNKLSQIKHPFIALLFGSYAKKTQSTFSDIDILVVSENEKEIRTIVDLIPENIHLTIVSYESFIKMNSSKEFTVVSEAIKNNIILLGIEEYYRLLQNAG